jgi:hypothetical protein
VPGEGVNPARTLTRKFKCFINRQNAETRSDTPFKGLSPDANSHIKRSVTDFL